MVYAVIDRVIYVVILGVIDVMVYAVIDSVALFLCTNIRVLCYCCD